MSGCSFIYEVDWEGEWIVILTFALQFVFALWLAIKACRGLHTTIQSTTIMFQFSIQVLYLGYFYLHAKTWASISVTVLAVISLVALIASSIHRKKLIQKYHQEIGCLHPEEHFKEGEAQMPFHSPTLTTPEWLT